MKVTDRVQWSIAGIPVSGLEFIAVVACASAGTLFILFGLRITLAWLIGVMR
jgi:hypothetical protein